jgi:hypothetical protein
VDLRPSNAPIKGKKSLCYLIYLFQPPLLFHIPLVMVFAYTAVNATQRPRHLFGAGAFSFPYQGFYHCQQVKG